MRNILGESIFVGCLTVALVIPKKTELWCKIFKIQMYRDEQKTTQKITKRRLRAADCAISRDS